ncbi:hypothetical protein NIES4103_68430 [Nostoc sp. NIES-4103]|nr:hypothetical protein NIES4103_68430 [Nostoc sp. NIES-4103]
MIVTDGLSKSFDTNSFAIRLEKFAQVGKPAHATFRKIQNPKWYQLSAAQKHSQDYSQDNRSTAEDE